MQKILRGTDSMTQPTCILLENARVVATCDAAMTRLKDASILIEGNRIKAVGPAAEIARLAPSGARRIDCSRSVVLPGFVNTHHHFFQTLTRALPLVQNAKLFNWLLGLYEVWRHVTAEAVHTGALVAMGELLLTGCTTTTDHHYLFPRRVGNGLIEEEIRAAQTLGIRFLATRGCMTLGRSKGGLPPDDVCQTDDEALKDMQSLLERFHDPSPLAMTRLALAPCAPFNVTLDVMRESAKLARHYKARMHTHLAETEDENVYCNQVYGKRPVDLMQDLGWLGDDVWLAHCVCLNDHEVKRFAETGTGVAHCPTSNLRLASGVAPLPKLVAAGVPVGLAVDGSSSNDSSDMLGEARQALLVHRGALCDPAATNTDMILKVATMGGARLLGYDKEVGIIEPGRAADLTVWRLDSIAYAGAAVHDPVSALLFCGTSHITDYTIVNGKVVVENGRLVFAAEDKIVEAANRIARALVEAQAAHKA